MAKTATPSGLTITRSDNTFTCKWKRNNSPTSQQFQYRLNVGGKWGKWTSLSITSGQTSRAIAPSKSSYYPSGKVLGVLQFRVRGKKNGKWSAWVLKTYYLAFPNTPTVTATLSNDYTNVCDFAYSVAVSTTDAKQFTNIEWQSVLQDGYSESQIKSIANWSTLTDYKSGVRTDTSYTITVTEQTTNIQSGSHTRWFRARARGMRGASDWAYTKHVYASPYQAVITSTKATQTATGNLVNVNWKVDEGSSAFPIDNVTVRYSMTVPDADMAFPSSGTWTDANISVDAGKLGAATFGIDTPLDIDQCLFVQVNTKHDTVTTYGIPTIVQKGRLDTPTGLSVSTNNTTYKATVTATNGSNVPDSFLAVKYCPASNPQGLVLGIIPHGSSSVTIQCPNWSAETAIAFEVYAVQGSYTTTSLQGGVTEYRINANMTSAPVSDGGSIPVAPQNVSVTATDVVGTVQVKWSWSWADADGAELSWADHEDAWESTAAPSTFEVTNLHSSKWNVVDLETGVTWYFRVRLFNKTGDDVTYGAYSDTYTIDLSSAPTTPVMKLSAGVIPTDGMTTATWAYITTDGTAQSYAEICEATYVSNVLTYGNVIASTQTAQHIDIYAEDVGWSAGEVHYLCLRVQSASGKLSDSWSDPVPVIIAEPITCTITSTSLVNDSETITVDGVTSVRNFKALTELPLTITVSGAGDADNVTVAIERTANYFLDRPDETEFVGYEGETVALGRRSGDGNVVFDVDDLLGMLDDGASYRIVATINDELGQSATDTLDFEVVWDHQALMPTATIALNGDIMEITPVAPTGTVAGDVCDIYRLSADKPQLIVSGAAWGTKYVDPYPTIGDFGGYRIVFKSKYGDYITTDNILAWEDYGKDENVYYYTPKSIIDFGSETVELLIDMTLSNEWSKDFKETKYLGGSVTGDWNKAVSRTGSINATNIRFLDAETISLLHRLADHTGICHVRMPDGTNIHADVEVSLNSDWGNSPKTTECSLSITRVDGEGLDGLTYAEWSA